MLPDDSLLWIHASKKTSFTLLSAELVEHFKWDSLNLITAHYYVSLKTDTDSLWIALVNWGALICCLSERCIKALTDYLLTRVWAVFNNSSLKAFLDDFRVWLFPLPCPANNSRIPNWHCRFIIVNVVLPVSIKWLCWLLTMTKWSWFPLMPSAKVPG